MLDPTTAATVSPWLTFGLQVLGTLIGAGVGAAVTWLLATRKLAAERAFDRRLEWHERMLEALTLANEAVLASLEEILSAPDTSPAKVESAIDEPLLRVQRERRAMLLYADPKVIRKIAGIFATQTREMGKLVSANNMVPPSVFMEVLVSLRDALTGASLAVAAEGRTHLGVEKQSEDELAEAAGIPRQLKAPEIGSRP
jgi:hypothetical protein